MTSRFFQTIDDALASARALIEFGSHILNPTVRLGVTGMSGAGKTVFITALVHGLIRGGRFPVFEALAGGRIAEARLAPQPDDAVPRFDYESHLRALVDGTPLARSRRAASASCASSSSIRPSAARCARSRSTSSIIPANGCSISPLLNKTYEEWSAESIALSWQGPRAGARRDHGTRISRH